MSVMSRLRGDTPTPDTTADDLREELGAVANQNELLAEAVSNLLAGEDAGWSKVGAAEDGNVTRSELAARSAKCRVLQRTNPLIRRGLALRMFYVWGDGVTISARAGEDSPAGDVNAVVQSFISDAANQAVLFGPTAREALETALGTDGNVFIALVTSPVEGAVRPRILPFDEVVDIICDPEDAAEPWFYKRTFTQVNPDPMVRGGASTEVVTALYPAVTYKPQAQAQLSAYSGLPIRWESPVLHVAVNRRLGTKFGLPDAYAATFWAELYKGFLVDWAGLVKSLSKIAWRATSKDSKRGAVQAGLSRALSDVGATGAAAVMGADDTLTAVPKTGATIDSGSGRPLAAMVASSLDVPVTMLLGDPGVTGARATAETLDRPTELMASLRRDVWRWAMQTICGYAIDQAVLARRGKLTGIVYRDDFDRETIELSGETDRTVEVTFPDLTETPMNLLMEALSKAEAMEIVPPLVMLRLVLQVLKMQDIDEILADVTDDDGNFVPPRATAGQAAVDAFNDGQDPASPFGTPAPAVPPADPAA